MEYAIEVDNLTRVYETEQQGKGLRRIWPKKKTFRAVDSISFKIKPGEFVGYVGANGSGKSTTIKMLTGVMIPSSGTAKCLGFVPWKQRYKYTYNIGVVFGQKSLLWTDLDVIESLKLYKDIYEISDKEFESRLKYFSKILDIDKILYRQARKLSFGEKMRANLAASLLHKPKVLFLDEPTVGMDVLAKEEVRNFLREINRKEGTTIMLTTHDMGDIEALCERVIMLDKGQIIYDGPLKKLKERYVDTKIVTARFNKIKNKNRLKTDLKKAKLIEMTDDVIKFSVNVKKHDINNVVNEGMKCLDIVDLTIEEQDLAEIVRNIYRSRR
ncbi:MAG: ATP-binding cassette domain-containing protein [Candidatus Micrarchaeota archaeon]